MGHTSGIGNGLALLALLALVALLVVIGVLFGIASLFGGWAYIVLGGAGGYGFSWFMGWKPNERYTVAGSGAFGGVIAWWVAASIGGVLGGIAAVFAGAIACGIALLAALFFFSK